MGDQREIIIVEKQGLWISGWMGQLQMARNKIGSLHTKLISKLNVCQVIFGSFAIIIQISIVALLYATHARSPKITSQFGYRAVTKNMVAGYFSGIVCILAGMAGKGSHSVTSRRRFFIWMVLESLSVCTGAVFIWMTVYSATTFFPPPDTPLSTRILGILIVVAESLSSLLILLQGIVVIGAVTRNLYVTKKDWKSFPNEEESSDDVETAAMNLVERAKVSKQQRIWRIKVVNHFGVTENNGAETSVNNLLIVQGLLGLLYVGPLVVGWWYMYPEERPAQVLCPITFIIACIYGIVLRWRIKKGSNQYVPYLMCGLALIEFFALGLNTYTLIMCVVYRAIFFLSPLGYSIVFYCGVILRTAGLFVSAVISYRLFDVLTINSNMSLH